MSSNSTNSGGSVPGFFRQGIETIGRSYLLSIAVFGMFLMVMGRFVLDGVLAGMFGIWGFTGTLIGLVGYGMYKYVFSL